MQVTLLPLTGWRESHASRCDQVVPKGKYQRYCSERIPTLRRDLLENIKFARWVEAKVFSSEVETEKWRRLLLRLMCVAIDVATDGCEEDFFPRNGN
ncbi:hypothetical protein Tco_1299794 [Tanacetum coccineum]